MLESTASLGQAVIAGVWDLFSTPVPGFTFTFRQMWLGFAVCSLSLLLLKYLLGGGGSSGSSTRSGSSRNPKISKSRKDDEF
ncbi:hypothetical protein [uncultured Oscillibacter sp.]|uniref:hypothetical protein n=1 Tax=uncultured Oscillibacter sp. TaxID=876091 RepID=UPI0025CF00AA|nr:hypothetical protein [uncultured Oscillibacter sp.]